MSNGKDISTVQQKIRDSEIPIKNKELILKFLNEGLANGLSESRLVKYGYLLPKISELLGKEFDEATRDDIVKLVAKVEQTDYRDWTKHDYKAIVKRFWKWLKKTEQYPVEVSWLKTTVKKNHELPDILTEEEVEKIVASADNYRDKAFITVLYESGCRISEVLNMKLRDVHFDKYSPIITVNGKTGSRRIRLIDKNNFLKMLLDSHTFKDNPEAYVWISRARNSENSPLSYRHASEIIKRLSKLAGINKKIYCHLFRHSRATFLANKLTESQLKQLFGWTAGSDMPATYVHLSGRDIDDALLKLNSAFEEKREKEAKLINSLDDALESDSDFRKKIARILLEKGIKTSKF